MGYLKQCIFPLGREVIEYQINTEWLPLVLSAAPSPPHSFCERESVWYLVHMSHPT